MSYQAKHAKSDHGVLWNIVFGPWTQSRLMSRKWWMAAGVIAILITLDQLGLIPDTDVIDAVQNIAIAYLGIQGVYDIAYGAYNYLGSRNRNYDDEV